MKEQKLVSAAKPDKGRPPARVVREATEHHGMPAFWISEGDPDNKPVWHKRVQHTVLDRMYKEGRGTIEWHEYDAGCRLNRDFHSATSGMAFAAVDFLTAGGGTPIGLSDRQAEAWNRVIRALDELDGLMHSAAVFVIGQGFAIHEWAHRLRYSGKQVSDERAAGIVHSTLTRLARHYRLTSDPGQGY